MALGIISIVGAFVLTTSLLLQRRRTESLDDISPLASDALSNIKRAYRASSKLNWPLYCAGVFALAGVVLLIIAGVMSL